MISKDEVQHIAKLARLELTEKEIEKMQKDLSEILGYFDLLKKAPKPEKSVKTEKSRKPKKTFCWISKKNMRRIFWLKYRSWKIIAKKN